MAKEYKSIEEAVKALDKSDAALVAEKEAHAKTKEALNDAEQVANDAITKVNEALASEGEKGVFVTVNKVKYKVNFGVDGKSKEDLKADKELLATLVSNGSNALSVAE